MTSFIICAAIITLATLAFLIWPLKRTRNTISYERHAQNIHFARERLDELDLQLKNATISATDYEALKLEIESTLAHDLDIANSEKQRQQDTPRRSNKIAISVLIVCIPLSAIGFYLVAGTPEAIVPKVSEQMSPDDIKQAIGNIEKRLTEKPNDLEGWKVISRTYIALGQYSEAENAYRNILRLEGESAETLASLADAIGLKNGGQVNEEALSFALKALELNSDNRQALWLIGLASAQQNDMPKAREYWNRLIPLLDSVPQQQQELRDIIAESYQGLEQQSESDNMVQNGDIAQNEIQISISLSPELSDLVDPSDTIFVFAKAKQGPPAPLAAKKLRASDLPITLRLSDADAMMAELSISKFKEILISARLSKSGQPIPQAGDFESASVETSNDTKETVELIISTVVQ